MALYPFTVNGVTYNLSDFQNLAYVTGLPNSMKDILRHALLDYSGNTGQTLSVTTGSKSLTIAAGKAFQAGDNVTIGLASDPANPDASRMYGTVTSYNFSTGDMVVDVTSVTDSGSSTGWKVSLGGIASPFTVSDWMLAMDLGGTGFGADSFVSPSGALALNEPSMAMKEIFDDFVGSQANDNLTGDAYTAKSPWVLDGGSAGKASFNIFSIPSGAADATKAAGLVRVYCDTATAAYKSPNSTILQYGENGFLHLGKGACRWRTRVYGVKLSTYYKARMGLKCHASGSGTNIFSSGGLGFEAEWNANNGNYVAVCGAGGQIRKIPTSIAPSTFDSLQVLVDSDGYEAEFYINNTLVAKFAGGLPVSGPENLLLPAYETVAYVSDGGVVTSTEFHVDYMYLSKYLSR